MGDFTKVPSEESMLITHRGRAPGTQKPNLQPHTQKTPLRTSNGYYRKGLGRLMHSIIVVPHRGDSESCSLEWCVNREREWKNQTLNILGSGKTNGRCERFYDGELHPPTTSKHFRDISTTRFTLMGDSPRYPQKRVCQSPTEEGHQEPKPKPPKPHTQQKLLSPPNIQKDIPERVLEIHCIASSLSLIREDPESCSKE